MVCAADHKASYKLQLYSRLIIQTVETLQDSRQVQHTWMRLETQLLPEFLSEYMQNFVMGFCALFKTWCSPDRACQGHKMLSL